MSFELDNTCVGQFAEDEILVSEELVESFAEYSGDYNPLHLDQAYAETTSFRRKVAHGMSYGAIFSRLIGMLLPGPGALWMSQSFRFEKPVFIDDRLKLRVEIEKANVSTRTLRLLCSAKNQQDDVVLSGVGEVMILEPDKEDASGEDGEPQKRLALVVGGARGIGAAVARRLDREGYSIALTYLTSQKESQALAEGLGDAVAFQSDVTDLDGTQSLLAQVRSRFGCTPDTVVFCASDRSIFGASADGSFVDFDKHFKTQIAGTHALVSALLPTMLENKRGCIIAIGTAATNASPPVGMAPYLVAKSGLQTYIQCLAVEYASKGIRANIVSPGMTETSLISGVPDRQRKVHAAQNPMRRLAKPEDVAGAVCYLASDDAQYVNGHTMIVSGGSII